MKSTLIQEEWRPVPNYIGLYDASNFGRVRNLKFEKVRILKQHEINGYLHVCLWKNGNYKNFYTHRLVYEAFNDEIPDGYEINHINEIKTDNSLWNLNIMTPKENINWGNGNQRRKKNNVNNPKLSQEVLQSTLDGVLVNEWPSMAEAARNGFDIRAVYRCCLGKQKTHKGFKWRKKESVL